MIHCKLDTGCTHEWHCGKTNECALDTFYRISNMTHIHCGAEGAELKFDLFLRLREWIKNTLPMNEQPEAIQELRDVMGIQEHKIDDWIMKTDNEYYTNIRNSGQFRITNKKINNDV